MLYTTLHFKNKQQSTTINIMHYLKSSKALMHYAFNSLGRTLVLHKILLTVFRQPSVIKPQTTAFSMPYMLIKRYWMKFINSFSERLVPDLFSKDTVMGCTMKQVQYATIMIKTVTVAFLTSLSSGVTTFLKCIFLNSRIVRTRNMV